MTRLTLQIKNVLALSFALATSILSGVAAKRFFDFPQREWEWLALAGTISFLAQVGLLLFVESKEEEELSLLRKQRVELSRQLLLESETISRQIMKDIESGNHESVERWQEVRRRMQ